MTNLAKQAVHIIMAFQRSILVPFSICQGRTCQQLFSGLMFFGFCCQVLLPSCAGALLSYSAAE